MSKGIFKTKKKDGSIYYRASITRAGKKISLGSFDDPIHAAHAYKEAVKLYDNPQITIDNFDEHLVSLDVDKAVCVLNYRDNKIYMKTPIYLRGTYFSYFLKNVGELKFDKEDMFYYSSHTIMQRGGHLFVNDYGSQYSLGERYGIKPYSVVNRDFRFVNGDQLDYRYQNLQILSKYHGVRVSFKKTKTVYTPKIHINGEYSLGRFSNAVDAAICYNKGVDLALSHGIQKAWRKNYIAELNSEEYHQRYEKIELSPKYISYLEENFAK